jgi:hypothetical protein
VLKAGSDFSDNPSRRSYTRKSTLESSFNEYINLVDGLKGFGNPSNVTDVGLRFSRALLEEPNACGRYVEPKFHHQYGSEYVPLGW